MNKSRILAMGLGCCLTTVAYAIPANRKPIRVTQPDGTEITLCLHGDENHHWITDANTGKRLVEDAEGYYVEAPWSDEVHIPNRAKRRQHDLRLTPPRRMVQEGDCNYLVILVGFADMKMTFGNEDFDRWLNVDGYYGTGSVSQYWRDNSGGKYRPKFTVVGPYNLPNKTAYYGAADSEGNYDVNPREMVVEAVQAAKADHSELDFCQFDNDGDGVMDNCYVIYAGYSQASTGVSTDIWPHSWYMADESLVVDGTVVYNYSCSQELVGNDRRLKKMDGIGTFTHEFGHILGLRDLYDTDDYENGLGQHPGNYSLYAHGSYNNESKTPAALWAFERNQMGWLEEGENLFRLTGDMDVTLDHFMTSGQAAYIDCQPGMEGGKEWIVVENRQQRGWDEYIPAHGLLIYHYDYSQQAQELNWDYNAPNNDAKHPCLYIKAADGDASELNSEGDTWPGMTGACTFADWTTPSARNWHGDATGTPLCNICETEDGRVKFQVGHGKTQWDVLRAIRPEHVRFDAATLVAEFALQNPAREYGLVWSEGKDALPVLGAADAQHCTVEPDAEGMARCRTNDLRAAQWYTVRPYAVDATGRVTYGSALLFETDYPVAVAPHYEDFTTDVDPNLDLPGNWEFVDRNGDGTSWKYSEGDGGVFYEFDYWNDADDWLISKRQWRVPTHGVLTIARGIASMSAVEDLEVYVSTGDRKIEDFVLHKQFSFADHFGEIAYEEVDLSAYTGQDIYIALRCTSQELQDALFLFLVTMTEKLQVPEAIHFGAQDVEATALQVEWSPVEGATKYYLWFGKQTDEVYNNTVFVHPDLWARHDDGVTLGAGQLTFTDSGEAELRTFPDGITGLNFLVLTQGPQGKSCLHVEGTVDGQTWTPVGPVIELTSYDSEGQEILWSDYLKDRGYTSLRFRFEDGGRDCRIKYLTLMYNDGYVYEDLAAGSILNGQTSATMKETVPGEFREGTYVVTVAAGDDWFFYDESDLCTYRYDASAIESVKTDAISRQQLYDLLGRGVKWNRPGLVIKNMDGKSAKILNR